MRRGLLVFLILLTNVTAGAAGVRTRELDHPVRRNVSFELFSNYLIVVRASAGPIHGLRFLVDTGASPTVLSPRVAEKLHLRTVTTYVAVLKGSVEAGFATLPSLQVGPIEKENFPVQVEDLDFIQKSLPVEIDGIVGLDVLGQSAFTIDYSSREIRFGPVPALPVSVPLEVSQGLPMIKVTVGQQPLRLLVDTGSPAMVLFAEVQPAPVGRTGETPKSEAIRDIDGRQVNLTSVTVGDMKLKRERVFVVQSHWDRGRDFDGLVSPAALGISKLAIDTAAGRAAFMR